MNFPKPPRNLFPLMGLLSFGSLQSTEGEGWFNGWRISFHDWTDIEVQFGVSQSGTTNAGDAIAGIEHYYEDGFVRLDNTGNYENLTSYWGYKYKTQVTEVAGSRTIAFHSIQPAPGADEFTSQEDIGNLPGLEIQGFHLFLKEESRAIGLETGIGFFAKKVGKSGDLELVAITDSYDANMPTFPPAGYIGTPEDTSPYLLGDIPTRTTLASTGTRELDTQFWLFRLGAFFEQDLLPKLSVSWHSGAILAIARGKFSYTEDFSGITFSGSGRDTNALWGGYAGAFSRFHLSEGITLFAGYTFQSLEDFEITVGNHVGRLDISETYSLQFGLESKF